VNTTSYKPHLRIPLNLQFRCSWRRWRTELILRSKGQRSRWRRGHIWSKKACMGIVKVRVASNLSDEGIVIDGLLWSII